MIHLMFFSLLLSTALGEERSKRQAADVDAPIDEEAIDVFTRELCSTKGAQEYFRLNTQDCRKVIQCTEVVSTKSVYIQFLEALQK